MLSLMVYNLQNYAASSVKYVHVGLVGLYIVIWRTSYLSAMLYAVHTVVWGDRRFLSTTGLKDVWSRTIFFFFIILFPLL